MKNSILSLIIIAVLAVLVGIIGIFVFHITEMAGIFSGVLFIATAINQYTGLNIWLARAVALPFLFFGVYWYGIKNILSLKGKKMTGYVSLIIVWMVACLAMYLSQGNFARASESEKLQALRYYFIDNKGQIVIRDHKGVDADTGLELNPITPEIWRQYELQQEDVLFDPKTGEARKRYYKAKDGTITLFPLETLYHPEYGTKLEKITSEIAQQVEKKTKPATVSGVADTLRSLKDEVVNSFSMGTYEIIKDDTKETIFRVVIEDVTHNNPIKIPLGDVKLWFTVNENPEPVNWEKNWRIEDFVLNGRFDKTSRIVEIRSCSGRNGFKISPEIVISNCYGVEQTSMYNNIHLATSFFIPKRELLGMPIISIDGHNWHRWDEKLKL